MLRRCVFLALIFLAMTVSTNVFAAIWYEQNFDKLKNGDLVGQDEWKTAQGQASTVVQSKIFFGDTGKAMQFSNNQEVVRWFDVKNSGVHYLSMFFRKEDNGGSNTYHVYMGGAAQEWQAGPVIRMGPQSGDPKMIGVHDGGTVKPVEPFKVKEWQHLRVVFDITKQKYSVYLDGKVIADNFNFRNPAHKTIQWLMIGFDGGSGIIGYADNIEMGEGEGKGAMKRALAVKPGSKLTATWGEIKRLSEK